MTNNRPGEPIDVHLLNVIDASTYRTGTPALVRLLPGSPYAFNRATCSRAVL